MPLTFTTPIKTYYATAADMQTLYSNGSIPGAYSFIWSDLLASTWINPLPPNFPFYQSFGSIYRRDTLGNTSKIVDNMNAPTFKEIFANPDLYGNTGLYNFAQAMVNANLEKADSAASPRDYIFVASRPIDPAKEALMGIGFVAAVTVGALALPALASTAPVGASSGVIAADLAPASGTLAAPLATGMGAAAIPALDVVTPILGTLAPAQLALSAGAGLVATESVLNAGATLGGQVITTTGAAVGTAGAVVGVLEKVGVLQPTPDPNAGGPSTPVTEPTGGAGWLLIALSLLFLL